MCNQDVRNAAKQNGIYLWELAEVLGMADSNFSRKLRKELTPEEKKKCFDFIKAREKEAAENEQ